MSDKKGKEENPFAAEVVEPDVETGPDSSGLVNIPSSAKQIDDFLHIADRIEEIIAAQNKIRMALLKLAQPGDWFKFGDKADIGFAGAGRISSAMGVSFTNWSKEKVTGQDEKGAWYRWELECDAEWRGRVARVYGRAGSRDKFFGFKDGEFRPLHDVNEGNIKMAAWHSCMKEGTRVLFGLHHMNPADLEKFGIKLIAPAGYEFKDKEKKAEETQVLEIAVKAVTMKAGKSNGKEWIRYTIHSEDGKEFTTFSQTDAQTAKDAQKEGKKVSVHFTVGQYGNNAQKVEVNG